MPLMDFSEGKTAFLDIKGLSPSAARTPLPPDWENQRYKVTLKTRFIDHNGVEQYVYGRQPGSNADSISYGIAASLHFFETPVSEDE